MTTVEENTSPKGTEARADKAGLLRVAAGKVQGLTGMAGDRLKALEKIIPSSLMPTSKPKDDVASPTQDGGQNDNYIKLKSRMTSWWNGHEGDNVSAQEAISVEEVDLPGADVWTPERFRVITELWGEGCMDPGGLPFTRKIFAPTKLDGKKTVLDLTVKLGGTAAFLATDANLWMDAYESDPDLMARATKHINGLGLGKRISLESVDYDSIELRERRYNLIYSRDRFIFIENKKSLLKKIGEALKTKGQFLLTDYMIGDPDKYEEEIATWTSTERLQTYPWTLELYKTELSELGFKVQSTHDFSEELLQHIHAGWRKVAQRIESGDIDRKFVDYLMQEGSIWSRRARAIKSGALQIHRILADSPYADK